MPQPQEMQPAWQTSSEGIWPKQEPQPNIQPERQHHPAKSTPEVRSPKWPPCAGGERSTIPSGQNGRMRSSAPAAKAASPVPSTSPDASSPANHSNLDFSPVGENWETA